MIQAVLSSIGKQTPCGALRPRILFFCTLIALPGLARGETPDSWEVIYDQGIAGTNESGSLTNEFALYFPFTPIFASDPGWRSRVAWIYEPPGVSTLSDYARADVRFTDGVQATVTVAFYSDPFSATPLEFAVNADPPTAFNQMSEPIGGGRMNITALLFGPRNADGSGGVGQIPFSVYFTSDGEIPEPSAFSLFALGTIIVCGGGRTRLRR